MAFLKSNDPYVKKTVLLWAVLFAHVALLTSAFDVN